MEPDDDPEARIRELERLEAARATELGVGHDNKPGPWPGQYVGQYAEGPRKGGFAAGRWVIGFVVVLMMFGVGAAIFSAMVFTRDGSVTTLRGVDPSITHDDRPGRPGTTALPGQPLTVSGVDGNRTIACNAGMVSVSGVRNTVTITGHCLRLTVSGFENAITVDSADIISASGFDNQVTYFFGSPQISSGGSNIVQQG